MSDQLTEKEAEALAEAMGTYRDKLRDSGWAGMNLADAIAISITANDARNKAEAEKNRVLTRIAKARGKNPTQINNIVDGVIEWKDAPEASD